MAAGKITKIPRIGIYENNDNLCSAHFENVFKTLFIAKYSDLKLENQNCENHKSKNLASLTNLILNTKTINFNASENEKMLFIESEKLKPGASQNRSEPVFSIGYESLDVQDCYRSNSMEAIMDNYGTQFHIE
ncbi:hypothetical protein KQX54_005210 [Cotesia glomerata]|uniref:Uncharacterized protein n=1 Tax=Cotesia glomerata TaxID=32391 RepID=A0AAV7J1P1_COTGL|nr:hypothetical protein KQX54_005210 [Cotesia glomerata]